MKILVLQHERIEHPGIFRSFLAADGHTWEAVELDEGETLPDLEGYDALWVMGGPMDTWQEDALPWLVAEKAFIRRAVKDEAKPFLGLCLGHQLLACALGAEVGPGTPEIALMDVAVTEPQPRTVFACLPDAVEVVSARMAALNATARMFYDNWMALCVPQNSDA